MSVTLTTQAGKPAVEIKAADGQVKTYRLEIVQATGLWTCTLWYCEEGGYVVRCRTSQDREWWSCSCKAWQFNSDRWTTGCKHTRTAKEIRAAIEALAS